MEQPGPELPFSSQECTAAEARSGSLLQDVAPGMWICAQATEATLRTGHVRACMSKGWAGGGADTQWSLGAWKKEMTKLIRSLNSKVKQPKALTRSRKFLGCRERNSNHHHPPLTPDAAEHPSASENTLCSSQTPLGQSLVL